MILLKHGEAKEVLDKLNAYMDDNYNEPYPNDNKITVKGYFRADSYDWTAFIFKKKAGEYKLKTTEHLQHEGYARRKIGLPMC